MLDSSSLFIDRTPTSAHGLRACRSKVQADDLGCGALRSLGRCLLRLPLAPDPGAPTPKTAAPAQIPGPIDPVPSAPPAPGLRTGAAHADDAAGQPDPAVGGVPYTPAWRACNALLGRAVINESGQPLGQIDELIMGPGRALSYLVIGIGSFLGGARHEVAVPLAQLQNQHGRLVLTGATQASLRAMPAFIEDDSLARREVFMAEAGRTIAQAQDDIAVLLLQAETASGSCRQALDRQAAALQQALQAALAKRAALRATTVIHWKAFAASLHIATHRLRLAVDHALR